ncbi:MAG: nuclear transport factor 2 family protein [Micropepsaceae bacterium]
MLTIARSLLILAALSLGGCIQQFGKHRPSNSVVSGPTTEQQLESALQRYSNRILAMDAAAVAGMYAPDGVWERQSGPLRGRDAIRGALAATGGVRVLSNEMTTATLSYNGPAVVQNGDFKQTVQLPNGKTVDAAGKFEATWVQSDNGEWWIRRMVTRPNK